MSCGVRCTHCELPGGFARESDRPWFCCAGCALAHQFTSGALEGGADRLLARVVLSAFLAMGVMVASLAQYGIHLNGGDDLERANETAQAFYGLYRLGALLLCLPIVALLGVPLVSAVTHGRRWLSADGLVVLGVGAALTTSLWSTFGGAGEVYYETVSMVLVLVGLGRWLDARAKERASAHLDDLAREVTPRANRLTATGEESVDLDDLAVGDRLRVRPGEWAPVDGVVLAGRAFLDTSALTGESQPRPVGVGSRVLAGSQNLDGALDLEATAVGAGRVQAEVERLLREALDQPGRHTRIADRVAALLVPFVVLLSLLTFVLVWESRGLEPALLAALAVALVSCPCALGVATPLAFHTALGEAWRRGMLVRGADVLERLAGARSIALDKTGTLTVGELRLTRIEPLTLPEAEALLLAARIETGSEHPIARALRAECELAQAPVDELRVLPGRGVEALLDGRRLRLVAAPSAGEETVVELQEHEPLARFHLAARLDPAAAPALAALRLAGYPLRILTGDGAGPARALAEHLGVDVAHDLLPADKVRLVEGERCVFVGDGLNDAAALAAAHVGVAVQGASPRSLSAADVHLLRAGVGALPDLLRLARRATSTARGNLAWAFAYNGLGWYLAATGALTPVAAAAAMVGSSAIVVLNSRRAAQVPPSSSHLVECPPGGERTRVGSCDPPTYSPESTRSSAASSTPSSACSR